jgi:hypothetical protein
LRSRQITLVAGITASFVGGCALIAGTNGFTVDPSLDDASTGGHDGGPGPDSPTGDALADGAEASTNPGDASDAGPDAADAREDASDTGVDGSIFTSLTSGWTTYDVHPAVTVDPDSYSGGAFDGHYMYFAPIGTTALRLDTTLPSGFNGTTAWDSQTVTAVGEDGGASAAQGFSGAVYDGKQYVYFVPDQTAGGAQTSQVVRYDTTASAGFNATSSWEAFDTRVHFGSKAAGFLGAVFDGRYLYFVPNGSGGSGTVVRYDTTVAFQSVTSWSSVDLTTLSSVGAAAFAGGLYVAPYLYMLPSDSTSVARYDTSGSSGAFNAASAWAAYDVSQGGTLPSGFAGGAAVGTDIFLVPNFNVQNGKYFGTVYEYDTSTIFGTMSSWSRFDTTQLPSSPQGFFGAAYDGRWVYFAPQLSEATGTAAFSGELARYDTTATFGLPGSWQSFDIASVNASAVGFSGSVFDGTYVYFIPGTNTTFARFLARTTPASPPFAASFY